MQGWLFPHLGTGQYQNSILHPVTHPLEHRWYHFFWKCWKIKTTTMTKTTKKTHRHFTALQPRKPLSTTTPRILGAWRSKPQKWVGFTWRVPTQKILQQQSLPPSNRGSGYDGMMVVSQFVLLSLSVFDYCDCCMLFVACWTAQDINV